MSINNDDDEYDLDDEILDDSFEEDLEAGLDDFDEDMSFDEDEALFEEDDALNQLANQESLGEEKKKFNIDIGFDKIAIIGAVLIGITVLIFQVTTKKAEQKVDVFQSVLTMKGASDGEVFGESQSKNIATISPERREDEKAFLYEPEALNDLPDNLKDGQIIGETEILPSDNNIVAKRDQSGEFLPVGQKDRTSPVDMKGEFITPQGDVVKREIVQNNPRAPQQTKTDNDAVASKIKENDIDVSMSDQDQKNIEEAKKELNFIPIEQVTVRQAPVSIVPDSTNNKMDETTPVSGQEQENAELLALKAEVERLKNEKLELQKQTEVLKETIPQKQETKTPPPKKSISTTPKKTTPATPKETVTTVTTWQLRAAQPGKAWISPFGKRDMIAVAVGDTIKGLGKIVAISNKDGKWIVVGTEGQVRQ